ncbi:hypothetical protein BDW69DRAFT_178427 [Aspergillus filifer]
MSLPICGNMPPSSSLCTRIQISPRIFCRCVRSVQKGIFSASYSHLPLIPSTSVAMVWLLLVRSLSARERWELTPQWLGQKLALKLSHLCCSGHLD